LTVSLAEAAAAFLGAAFVAVVFFGAEDATDLLGAADLGFVLTVLAFSFLMDDAGADELSGTLAVACPFDGAAELAGASDGVTASAFGVAVPPPSPIGTGCVFATSMTSGPDACCAAASISDDVTTFRRSGAVTLFEGVDLGDGAETAFLTIFPDVFVLEPAIASTS
jgi:hypothetical protein